MIKIDKIIVEGADQQGKSQLCEKLSQTLGWPIIHFDKPDEKFDFHSHYITPKKTISDRNFVSEMVYSLFRDQKHRVKNPVELQKIFESQNCLFILVDREEDFVFDSERNEAFSYDQILAARKMYEAIFYAVSMNKIRVNPNNLARLMQLFQIM